MKIKTLKDWKDPALLLTSIGLSSMGDFIYLVAINIIVYQMTGSAAAVAALWVIAPIVNIATKFWTGSFIDYRSKKHIIITSYFLRAFFIFFIPFAPNMFFIYLILVLLSVAKSFFVPASMTYITMIVPKEKRKRFNSVRSFVSSGAFIIGPALAGVFILTTNIHLTLWINTIFFILAGVLTVFLPKERMDHQMIPKLSFLQIKTDFTAVIQFIHNNKYVAFIYISFLMVTLFSFAMDTQEVVFTQDVVGLSEVDYTLLISITGIGSLAGGLILSVFSNKISIRYMIVIGLIMMTSGYVIYAFSWSFLSVTIGFIILGFFNIFLNAGIMTFYQNNIPVQLMGRVTSIFQLIESVFQILFILMIGVIADWFSLRLTIVTLAILMMLSSFVFIIFVLNPQNKQFYKEEQENLQA
ncbi:MFS transporter [Cytobacillus purgationiresistens]|uniref:MFS family permease n=1 Tax=Cytobacillus purgationiresistens TaxID=863449 RepID=A0ABU0AAZ8_9BACI|nr:MFS transporter [Cytobacillus purgationiresistens]MDQ0268426.1 MFS family permease [Cytobacillus purgationiresistens]